MRHAVHGWITKFMFIRHQNRLAGISQNCASSSNFLIIEIQKGASLINATNSDNADIQTKIINEIDRAGSDNTTIIIAHFAPRNHDFETIIIGEDLRNIDIVCHNMKVFMFQ